VEKNEKLETSAMMKILIFDNYDSFTYNLCDYFLRLGASCTVVRNDEWTKEQFQSFDFDGLVLSPGPKKPKDAGLLMWAIEYFHDKKPIFGICLGHQGLGEFFGAELIKAKLPVHGKTSLIQHNDSFLFNELPSSFKVMRYHSLLLKTLEKTDLVASSFTKEGEIMSFYHKFLPLTGVQFHPESILTEHGLKLLSNWLESI
jgi:anthranilate synthase/aminodeoxychorismate synthase-like glutamine amidotransferase